MRGLPPPPPEGSSALPAGSLDGQVVLVTGGGTGLGKALAVEFGRLSAAVAIVSRDAGHRAAGVAAVEAVGAQAFATACDVRDEVQIAAVWRGAGPSFSSGSRGWPTRRAGTLASWSSARPGTARIAAASSACGMRPGTRRLARMPWGAHSTASVSTIWRCPWTSRWCWSATGRSRW